MAKREPTPHTSHAPTPELFLGPQPPRRRPHLLRDLAMLALAILAVAAATQAAAQTGAAAATQAAA
jgi:hypothetical protein